LQDLAGEVVVVGLEPRRDRCGQVCCVPDDLLDRASGLQGDHVVGPHLKARDVHTAAVHLEVAVPDDLARLGPRGGKAKAIDDVVEARLEHAQKRLARDALGLGGLLVVVTELLLENAVVPTRLLLFAELQEVLRLLDAAPAMLTGRVAAALDGALFGQAALTFEEELHALAAALLALGTE